MVKKVNAVTTKLALGDVDSKAVFLKSLEQQVKMLLVHYHVLASHQGIIIVNKGKIQTLTDNAHQVLDGLDSISLGQMAFSEICKA